MALVTNVLTGGLNNHPTTSEEMNGIYTDFVSQGVVGVVGNTVGVSPATGSFAVNAQGSPDMTVAITAGVAYVTATPASQNSQRFRIKNTASANLTISANSSGSTKYDWVYVKLDPTNLNTPNVAGDNAASFFTSRSSSLTSDDGTPPTYGYCIAVITVSNGAATITNGNITDKRVQVTLATGSSSSVVGTDGWATLNATLSNITYLGNRSYSATTSSDQSAILSPGMRLRTTRTVAGPVQSTSLNGTTQYYSKSSPAGLTFTDDFVVGAWVKLSSYGSADQAIMGRYSGGNGWGMFVNTSGQVLLSGYNGGAGNNSRVVSYQSIPLNKWVHVVAQLDMSAFSSTPVGTNSYIMIDGEDAPVSVSRAGTNPTALVQGGDLNVGANVATSQIAAKIAQAFFAPAKVTQANIRTLYSQGITAALITSLGLGSAYSFDNSTTDLNTTNANNLTANGSAVATNTDSFSGTQGSGSISSTLDYAVLTAVGSSTINFQVPEGCTVPTSGGVSAVSYATTDTPYGFPRDSSRWEVIAMYVVAQAGTTTANAYAQYGGAQISVPIGCIPEFDVDVNASKSSASQIDASFALSTSTSAASDIELTKAWGNNDVFVARMNLSSSLHRAVAAKTTYYGIGRVIQATISSQAMSAGAAASFLIARCAYV